MFFFNVGNLKIVVPFKAKSRIFFSKSVQTDRGSQLASYSAGNGDCFLGVQ